MSFLKGVVKGLGKFVLGGGLLGLGINALAGKKKKPPVALPQATRDDAEAMAARDDALRLRRGSAADLLTGAAGAEPGGSALGRFVLGS